MYRAVLLPDPLARVVGLLPCIVDGELATGSLRGAAREERDVFTAGGLPGFSAEGMASHPSMGRRDRQASCISDFLSPGEWHRRALYQEARPVVRIEDDLGCDCEWMPGNTFSVCVIRDRRSFCAEDRMLFDLLAEHLPILLRLMLGRGQGSEAHAAEFAARAIGSGPAEPVSPGQVRRTLQARQAGGRGLRLSGREQEVLSWLAEGKTNQEIALILGISQGTVKRHLENIYGKLGVENRLAAVAATCGRLRP